MNLVAAQVSPGSIRGAEAEERAAPRAGYWFLLKVVGIMGAIYLMAGWSPNQAAWILVSLYLISLSYIARKQDGDKGLSILAYLLVLAVACSATTAAVWFGLGESFECADLALPLLIGFLIADGIDRSVVDDRLRRSRDTLRIEIAKPILFDRTGQGDLQEFDPHWPFCSRGDLSVWAIDPVRRSIRILRPLPTGDDHLLQWDVPIRAVELRRVSSELLGTRDLYVLSGHERAAEWSHVFQFSSGDKSLALKWRDTFEAWLREDQRKGAATASSR